MTASSAAAGAAPVSILSSAAIAPTRSEPCGVCGGSMRRVLVSPPRPAVGQGLLGRLHAPGQVLRIPSLACSGELGCFGCS